MTRSVGLKGQGGPGVSETRGGARDVIDRRHEAPPRVTGKPSATLRLRHPVPALPPFWLHWRRLLERVRNESSLSRVRRTVCFGCSNRQPTVRPNSAAPTSVALLPVRSLSSVGLVDLSNPTAVSSGDWWVDVGSRSRASAERILVVASPTNGLFRLFKPPTDGVYTNGVLFGHCRQLD